MENTVTISKIEYQRLHRVAKQYRAASHFFKKELKEAEELVIAPHASVSEIIQDFKNTGLYNQAFLRSLETGLKRSSAFGKPGVKSKRK